MSTTVRITVNRSGERKGEEFGRKGGKGAEGDPGEAEGDPEADGIRGAEGDPGKAEGHAGKAQGWVMAGRKARGPSAPPMDGGPERPRFKPSSTWGRSYAAMRELS